MIAVILSLTVIYGYVGVRLILPTSLDRGWKSVLWALVLLFFAAPFLAIFLRSKMPTDLIATIVSWIAYLSFGFFTLTFAVLLLRDALLLISLIIETFFRLAANTGKTVLTGPSRRLFLINGTNLGVLGISGALTAYGLAQARKIPSVRQVDAPVENLPDEFHGFRILQLTDLHVSMTIRRDYVQRVVDRANDQKPDLIVFTGDLADGGAHALRSETAPLANLKAPWGKFFVTGNHEYYSGVAGWLAEARRWGFVPLINEHRIIRLSGAEIVLAGITDYRAAHIEPSHESNPEAALAGAPVQAAKIMLAHQPKSIFGAEAAGADLLICGHTHGGQYVPFNLMVPLDQPYVHGLHKHGRTWIYVSRGAGYWGPPIRVGAPSEITVLRLTNQQIVET